MMSVCAYCSTCLDHCIHVQVRYMYYIVGGIAVIKSYVAASTTEEKRSVGMAGISGSQAVGLMVGQGMKERIKRGLPNCLNNFLIFTV